jgi:hypothetical protein
MQTVSGQQNKKLLVGQEEYSVGKGVPATMQEKGNMSIIYVIMRDRSLSRPFSKKLL